MNKIFLLFFAALLIAGTNTSFAQGCEDPPSDDDGSKIFGFIQPQHVTHMYEENESTFNFKRARIGLTGNIPYDFSYYVVLETSPFVSKTDDPMLLDAFIAYKRFKWAKFAFGSFKQPFGQEVNTSCSGLHTIERSLASDQFVAPQRDMGFMISGGTKEDAIQYYAAIMNGSGIGGAINDNNKKQDLIGRLTIKPLLLLGMENGGWLRLGGSYRVGYPNAVEKERTSYAAEMQVEWNNLLVQGEYISDEGDYTLGGGGCGSSDPIVFGEKRDGAYIQALYMTPWMLQPVVKYEFMNTDNDVSADNSEYSIMTFGANYWFNDWTRLQVNYRYRAESGAIKEYDNDEILIQLQVKF